MNNICYIICDNDGTEFVIIGDENQANKKLEELKEKCKQSCIKNYGYERGAIEFSLHYWHLHTVAFEAYFPEKENNICPRCGGDKFVEVFADINQMATEPCPTCNSKGKINEPKI